jgi:hypothetical protein
MAAYAAIQAKPDEAYNYNMSAWLGEDQPNSRSYQAQRLYAQLQGP